MAAIGTRYAKLTRPHLYGAVARTQLFAKLDAARARHQAIHVFGPPGSGKTTSVASWVGSRGIGGIWYQITSDDADLATFFHYITEASRRFWRKKQSPLPLPSLERLRDVRVFGRRFFRELFTRMPRPSILVLDNYQEVPAQSELHQVVLDAIEELPETITVITISRLGPPSSHARLIAGERLLLIDWQDLRLTLQETRDITLRKGDIDDAMIRLLHERSGGWAAGLTLLLEGTNLDRATAVDAPRTDAVFDYFTVEIFLSEPESVRYFLMATAHLPSVGVSIAEQLTGNSGAAEILERFHRRHLFIHRIPGNEPTYRYHAMFRDFLLQRARETWSADTRRAVVSKASNLLCDLGEWDTAASLCCEAEEWDRLITLLTAHARELLTQGRWRTLQDWLRRLPPQKLDINPWVRYWSGVSLSAVDVMQGRDELECAFALFRERGDLEGQMLCATEILRAFFVEFRSFERVDPWIDLLGELVSSCSAVLCPETELRIYSGLLGALVSRRPAHPLIEKCVQRTHSMIEHVLDSNLVVTAGISLSFYATMCGRIDLAEDAAAIVRPHLEREQVSPVLKIFWIGSHGYLCYVAGDSMRALPLFEEAERLSNENHLTARISFIRAWHAYCLRRLGRLDEAEAIARQIEELATDAGARRNVLWLRALNERTCGRLTSAVKMGAEALGGDKSSECTLHGSQHLQQAELLVEAGLHDLAPKWIEQAKAQILGTFSEQAWRPVILLLEALMALRRGEQEDCRESTREALSLLRGVRSLVFVRWFPYALSQLMPIALEASIETDTACRLIRELGIPGPRPPMQNWPWLIRLYTLGRFEVVIDGSPLRFSRKTPRRLITLLKALVAFGGQEVPERKLIDAIWPDELGDAAAHALTVALHRLRRLLRIPQAIRAADGKISFDDTVVWTDVSQFENDLTNAGEDLEKMRRAIEIYGGEFLADEPDSTWAVSLRERLRGKLLYHIERAGRAFESANRYEDAVALYMRGVDADVLSESFYQGLMRCYAAQDRRAEALSVYRRMRQQLSVVLGMQPSRSSETLARELRL